MVFQENSPSPRCPFPHKHLSRKIGLHICLRAAPPSYSRFPGLHRHVQIWMAPASFCALFPLSHSCCFPLPVSILPLGSKLSPISRAHRSQIHLFDSEMYCTRGRGYSEGPCGAESVPGIWDGGCKAEGSKVSRQYWGRVKQDRMSPVVSIRG